MNAIEKRARELLDAELRKLGLHEDAYHVGCGADLDRNDQAAIHAIIAALTPPEGYVLVQRTPLMDMLDEGWDAMDQEGNGDFFMPKDLAPAWAAMLSWCERNPGSEP